MRHLISFEIRYYMRDFDDHWQLYSNLFVVPPRTDNPAMSSNGKFMILFQGDHWDCFSYCVHTSGHNNKSRARIKSQWISLSNHTKTCHVYYIPGAPKDDQSWCVSFSPPDITVINTDKRLCFERKIMEIKPFSLLLLLYKIDKSDGLWDK